MAKEIIIEPSANIFASLGIKEIEIQEIRYNERYKRLSIDCFLLSTDFFHEIDTLENKLKNHFGEKLIVEIKLTLKTTEIKKAPFLLRSLPAFVALSSSPSLRLPLLRSKAFVVISKNILPTHHGRDALISGRDALVPGRVNRSL